MPEQFANTVSTTLASGYTAGSGSIVVASATGLPSVGDFAVSLQNAQKTILKCTARSGTTLTVTAEANDANAASGTVVLATMLSARNLSLLMQEPGSAAPYLVTPTLSRGLLPRMVPPIAANYAWINQGGATEDTTYGFPYLAVPSSATGNNLRIRKKAQPATPYLITVAFQMLFRAIDFTDAGIVFRESATGKLEVVRLASAAASVSLMLTTASGPTALVSNVFTIGIQGSGGFGGIFWLRIGNNNTNLSYEYSENGLYWTKFGPDRAKATYFTSGPDEVGYFCNASNAGVGHTASFYSWAET
jgi:hypothetical protein